MNEGEEHSESNVAAAGTPRSTPGLTTWLNRGQTCHNQDRPDSREGQLEGVDWAKVAECQQGQTAVCERSRPDRESIGSFGGPGNGCHGGVWVC